MSAALKRPLTPEEYLAIERAASTRSEFHHGNLHAMAGASRHHNRLFHNMSFLIQQQIKGGPCILQGPDMRVASANRRDYFYPDLVIVCHTPAYLDNTFDTLLNPEVIIEILSESTGSYDRTGKFRAYRNIDSLKEYVLVSQDGVQIERYVRQSELDWRISIFKDAGGTFSFGSMPISMTMTDIYEGVEFPDAPEA